MHAELLDCVQFFATPCCSPPGSSVHGILWARILEWVAIPFSRESSWPRDQTCVSCIADEFFSVWVTKEALLDTYCVLIQGWLRIRDTGSEVGVFCLFPPLSYHWFYSRTCIILLLISMCWVREWEFPVFDKLNT